jgi:hypothetical protein
MKKRSMVRLIPVSVVLALLMLAVLPSTILAAEKTSRAYPREVAVGGSVTVKGEYYDKDYPATATRGGFVFVSVYFSADQAETGDLIGVDVTTYAMVTVSSRVDEFGRWETGFRVPSRLAYGSDDADAGAVVLEGPYYVYVTYWNDDVIVAVHEVEVSARANELRAFRWSPYYGGSWWYPYYDCSPCDDCWGYPDDYVIYPYPWWGPPYDWCDEWPDNCCDGWYGGYCDGWSDGCCYDRPNDCCGDWSDDWYGCPPPPSPYPYPWPPYPCAPADA